MLLRLRQYLLIALLLLGQAGAWLHGLTHHLEPVTVESLVGHPSGSGHEQDAPDDGVEPCVVCLAAATFGLALLAAGLVFASPLPGFAQPAAFLRRRVFRRNWSRSARGPPNYS